MHNVYNLEIVPLVHLLHGAILLQGKAGRLDLEMCTKCTVYLASQERGSDRQGPFNNLLEADRRELERCTMCTC